MQTFGQLSPHSGERLHSSDDEAASNDRLGRRAEWPRLAGSCLSPLERAASQSRHCDRSTFWLLSTGHPLASRRTTDLEDFMCDCSC